MRREKQAWQGRREGAYQERTCPTENAARRSFFARRTLPTLLVEALNAAAETMNRAGRFTPALRSYALLVLAAIVFAPAAGGSTAGASGSGTEDDIQELLDRRAAAVMAGDLDSFMETIARDSEHFVRRQRRLFKRMQGVPLASYRLVARTDRLGDLVTEGLRSRYRGADDVAIPVTEERYRLAGFDVAEAIEDMFYTFVQREGEWLIAEDSDLEDLTFYSGRHLWDYSRVDARRAGRFLLLEPACRGCPQAPSAAVRLATQALRRVRGYWDAPWSKRVPIVIPTSADDLQRMLKVTFELDNFVAFAYSSVDRSDGIDYTGHRILLNPDAFTDRSSSSTLRVLTHELLHVATRSASGPFVPTFLEEGIAEYVGQDADPAALSFFHEEAAAGTFDGRLPEDFRFVIGSGRDVFRSYQKAYSAATFFVDRWGLRKLVQFYRRLGAVEVAPGTAGYHVDRALRRTVGVRLDQFEQSWAGSIDNS